MTKCVWFLRESEEEAFYDYNAMQLAGEGTAIEPVKEYEVFRKLIISLLDPASFLTILRSGFPEFLKNMTDPMKDEYLLPIIADGMLKEGTEFTVLSTDDHWFGVTYQEDRPAVEAAFRKLVEDGEYKADLYSDL